MVETLQVQQIMAEQQIRKYLLLYLLVVLNYYEYLKRDHECKYCYSDLQ